MVASAWEDNELCPAWKSVIIICNISVSSKCIMKTKMKIYFTAIFIAFLLANTSFDLTTWNGRYKQSTFHLIVADVCKFWATFIFLHLRRKFMCPVFWFPTLFSPINGINFILVICTESIVWAQTLWGKIGLWGKRCLFCCIATK